MKENVLPGSLSFDLTPAFKEDINKIVKSLKASKATGPDRIPLKGCLRYLNRCGTSTTYILYQLDGKKEELTITFYISLTLNIAIFKKGACQ